MTALALTAVGGTGGQAGLEEVNVSTKVHMDGIYAAALNSTVPIYRRSLRRFAAWGCLKTYVALAADHLVAVELAGQGLQGGLDDTTAQAEHQVQSRLLLDVVVRQGAAVLQLLARENKALLVWGNALLVLDLGLDIVDRVRGLDLQGDGLAGKGLHEAVLRNDVSICAALRRSCDNRLEMSSSMSSKSC